MTEHIELVPFFERQDGSLEGFPADSYVAGFRRRDRSSAVEITLPARMVEHTVLTGARLSLWLCLDGRLVLDGEGLDDESLEAASTAGKLHEQNLTSLVAASLDPELLAAEDSPVAELSSLRTQLANALAQVDGALERLKHR
jgi:hypothetical protein